MLGFIYILSAIAFVLFGLVILTLYKKICLRNRTYVIQKDVEKQVELPPIDTNMEFKKESVQKDSGKLIDTTV